MIKGWCPGALRPMASGDGLIVRLKLSGGIVDTRLAAEIARWSRRWGNGEIDLTARANLQLRGLSERFLPALYDAMAEWELLDTSADAEAVRNVVASPLAGIDPDAVLDIRPIVAALEQRLAADTTLHALPGKFGFAVDDGGRVGLDGVAADVRFEARPGVDGPEFAIWLGNANSPPPLEGGGWGEGSASATVRNVSRSGSCPRPPPLTGAKELVDVAVALAQVFLDARNGHETSIRRMGDLVALIGAEAIFQQAGLAHSCPTSAVRRRTDPPHVLGSQQLGSGAFLGVGLPFGRIVAEEFAALATAAALNGAEDVRLTPWRAILVPLPSIQAAQAVSAALTATTFILDSKDARRRVAACPGAPSCTHGSTPVRNDAARLARELADAPGSGTILHVSGCDKGCAHPYPAPVTLVAQDGRYHLIRNGTATDVSLQRNLTVEQVAEYLRAIKSRHGAPA